jgi:hypothetical protein
MAQKDIQLILYRLTEQDRKLDAIHDQAVKTNQRVSKLEKWQSFIEGGLAVFDHSGRPDRDLRGRVRWVRLPGYRALNAYVARSSYRRCSMPNQHSKQPQTGAGRQRVTPTAAAVLEDGALVELVHDPKARRTSLAVWRGPAYDLVSNLELPTGERLVPYSAGNNLIRHDVILLPSEPEEYGSEAELVAEIQAYIHRYVDLTPQFERIASYYVLFSWLYDGFNELPYLRVRGDYGSGKTRFLLVVGSICYKPVFASGASTVSPIFHILDAFRGTLIIDEGDFRWSDDKADIVKILNNGNVKGLPVLRTEVSRTGEFNPRAFQVFGPKIVATRGFYEDRALESRFITEETGHRRLRRDIPINLPAACKEEALTLRNKLLLYRFRNFAKKLPIDALVDPTLEPRLNQIFVPLLSVINDPTIRAELREVARERHREIVADRGMDIEAQVLEVIKNLEGQQSKLAVGEVTAAFIDRYGKEYERPITNKWIGHIIRRKLSIKTQKSHGVFIIPLGERERLRRLYEKYGIIDPPTSEYEGESRVDVGEVGDVNPETGVE